MKRGIAEHPKTKRLARLLGIPVPYAVGLVEMLCNQWAPKAAVCGDIGKWEDVDIAEGIGWPGGDPIALIEAFIAAGQVDRHPTHRLVIHDWHEHCDESVKKTVKKHGYTFANLPPTPNDSAPNPEPSRTVRDHSGMVLDQSSTVPSINAERLAKAKAKAKASSGTAENYEERPATNPLSASDAAERTTAPARVATLTPAKEGSLEYWRERAHREFPALVQQNFRGAVASCVWKDVCGGPPPPSKLEPLDGVRDVPADRLALGLKRYLAAKRKVAGAFYGIADFVAHIGDWVPKAAEPGRRVIRSDADLTPEERAVAARLEKTRGRDRRETKAQPAHAVHPANAERHGESGAGSSRTGPGGGDAARPRGADRSAPDAGPDGRQTPVLGVARGARDPVPARPAAERSPGERVAATAAAPDADRRSGVTASPAATVSTVGSLVAGLVAHTRMPT